MAKIIHFATVICTLIVLPLTTTTKALWKPCFDDSCPIKNIKIKYNFAFSSGEGDIERSWSDDGTLFVLETHSDLVQKTRTQHDDHNVIFTCSVPDIKIPVDSYKRANIDYQIQPEINGTAIYLNDTMLCSWSIMIGNSTFPFELIDPPQYYISESGYQIYYNLTQTVPIAAANYSQLPESVDTFVDGYQYKAVGSEKYLLIARVTNETTDFLLKVNGQTPRWVQVNLEGAIGINIECNFEQRFVISSIRAYLNPGEGKIDGDECRWSLSEAFEVHWQPTKIKDTTYELQIIENSRFVHFHGNNFRITTPTSASSSLTIAKSLLIVMLFSAIFI
uniref:DOMON domain-containing protein n=1 Tax=Tetranychus urticae TaxID=32264 RepID=T1K7K1_TETUR